MIQPDHVYVFQQGAQAVEAPAITGSPEHIPVVNWIAPELPLRAEVIRRHPGHKTRPVLPVQLEQFRVGPHFA